MSGAKAFPARVDVCVCTFRRKELEATLRSLGALRVPDGVSLRIIVADNDDSPSAEYIVRRVAGDISHDVVYRHAPARNISVARNACLDAVTADFAAFIDDDETAGEGWLEALLRTAQATGADAVLGPVRAVYAQGAPAWMKAADIHATLPVFVNGEIRTGYTCNVLLRAASPAVSGRRFALALGRTGGEDTAYFTGLHRDGGRIAYAPDALVLEPVPEPRARFSWLAKRRFRMGQTHGRIVIGERRGVALAKALTMAAAKASACFAGAVATGFSGARRNRFLLRGLMHLGVVSGLAGVSEIAQYGGDAGSGGNDTPRGRANAA